MSRVNFRLLLVALIFVPAAPAAFSQTVSFARSTGPNFSRLHADFNSDSTWAGTIEHKKQEVSDRLATPCFYARNK
jgi:hypothetical protein